LQHIYLKMTNNDTLLILKQYPLWEKLSHDQYVQLEVVDNFKEAREGEFIYFEAFQHNHIHFIKKGHIKMGYLDEAGNRMVKDILGPGDFFGQVSLEKTNLKGEFAQAMKSNVSLCSFTVDHFNALLNSQPDMAIRYSKLIGLRMKRFENRLVNILQKDVKTRVLLFLEQLLHDAKNPRHFHDNEVRIDNYLTHEEIAQLIGTSRQTVTTIFNELRDEGVCIYSRKEIAFVNFDNKLLH
jgi:CRP/FNR family transcriptional regulator, cyclic AMP receptor protein